MADIVIINPRFEPSFWGMEHALDLFGVKSSLPVASLPLLAALTPAGHTVTLIDENVEEIDWERCAKADIVGLTGMVVQRFRMREILSELKSRGCFVVVGGPWVTVKEDYFGNLADVIFIGEAETTWPQFLEEWAAGKHIQRYEQAERTDMSTVPVPRFDLLKMNEYSLASVQFSRGCPFACEFCDIIVTFGRRPRIKGAEQVIAELEALRATGIDTAFIVDDNLIGNKKAIKVVLRRVAQWQRDSGFPIAFLTEASLDLADDGELMDLMVDCNIRTVFVGIETPNEESLRETGKLQNLRGKVTLVDKVKAIQQRGMEVWSGMMLGFDHDDATIFDRQIAFVEAADIVNCMVGMVSAIPKTPLYTRLNIAGRLDHDDRPKWGTNILPVGMSQETLRDGFLRVMRHLYDPKVYFDRLDRLYADDFDGKQSAPRSKHMRRHPLRRLQMNAVLLAEAAVVFWRLTMTLGDKQLRKEYRRVLGKLLKRRPTPQLMQTYAVKSAMHYHTHKLIASMAGGGIVNSF
ncbi:MAG: DUF4070 domain-containing protein [Rhodospirillales bacterium]